MDAKIIQIDKLLREYPLFTSNIAQAEALCAESANCELKAVYHHIQIINGKQTVDTYQSLVSLIETPSIVYIHIGLPMHTAEVLGEH